MAEYIEREALIDNLNRFAPEHYSALINMLIEKQPAADVVPVRHERWVYHECVSSHGGAISGYSCSGCSAFVNEDIFDSDEFHKVFCGGCGARMDLEGEGGEDNYVPTNADRIRSMSDEELASSCLLPCPHIDSPDDECKFGWHTPEKTCAECILDWLKQPAKGECVL